MRWVLSECNIALSVLFPPTPSILLWSVVQPISSPVGTKKVEVSEHVINGNLVLREMGEREMSTIIMHDATTC